jgi:glycosyltransferase involved in cell wall biosynthesis
MHILYLADASSVHSYRWIKYFSKKDGITVTWCSFNQNTMPKLKNVEFKLLDKSSLVGLFNAIRYIKGKSPDIIHAHYLGWNGFLSLFFPHFPIILTAWGSDIVYNSQKRLMRFVIRRMMKKATLLTCDAHHLTNKMVELGAPKDNVEIIMFGIDERLFVSKRSPFTLSEENTNFIIGSIRNLHPVYDVITFLKAAKIVLAQRNNVIFHVAGSGPDINLLKKFVTDNSLDDSVLFLGRLDSAELFNFYEDLDIYVSTALSDGGIASSTAEAMLCARPVIITDVAENGDWISDKKNGRLFDCGDHSALANLIMNTLDNQSDSVELGLNAKETIVQRNTYKNEMEKMFLIYKRVKDDFSQKT